MWGSNAREAHPIFFHHVLKGIRNGAKLVVVDPRRTETAERADLHLPIAPDSDVALFNGLLAEARMRAAANAELLYPLASRGEPILFLEPSCLSAVCEDASDLLSGESRAKAQVVAQASALFEDWVERAYQSGQAAVTLRPGQATTILLHGHCHQKAMGLVASAKALLSRVPGATVVDLPFLDLPRKRA